MVRLILFILGVLILIGSEMLKVYFIMPFPGSQQKETVGIAYFLHSNIWFFRIAGILIAAYPAFIFMKSPRVWVKWPVMVVLAFWLMVVYAFNFRFLADKMFYQPKVKLMTSAGDNKVDAKSLIIGVSLNGESKAYPIEIIGYHHQVRDTIGGEPVMISYCTVCRTGRVFSPFIDEQPETFRLVGMDHFNAMFEDSRTKSWWRQANGEAVVGPLKGKLLNEIPSQQMTLRAWLNEHPNSHVLQPDSSFIDAYKGLAEYDEGKKKGRLESTDSLSWRDKSWVIGVQIGMTSRAYDWIDLKGRKVINDTLASESVLIAIENDSVNFHVWTRPDSLSFVYSDSLNLLTDQQTKSLWDWNGRCIDGTLKGNQLNWQQSYQEYWHSWRTFHPQSTRYNSSN